MPVEVPIRDSLDKALTLAAAEKVGIFRDHHCWACKDGERPCVNGSPNRCEYPHARNE